MKSLVLAVVIAFSIISGVLIWCLFTLSERIDYLEKKFDSYQETTRMRFDKTREASLKLDYLQKEHDKMIELLRLRQNKLSEKKKRLTFDSTGPGYHRELSKALTELKGIKDALAKGKNEKWIKLKDRPPALHETVLVKDIDGDVTCAYRLRDDPYFYESISGRDISNVVEWMRIPE
jgi:hypothetical protein